MPPHEGKHEQIDAATKAIEEAPKDYSRRMARAELYLVHGELKACRSDLEVARSMAPQEPSRQLMEGRLEFACGEFEQALALAQPFLLSEERDQQYFTALLLRAELHLTCEEGGLSKAITGLEQGVERMGPVVGLLLRLAQLEEEAGRIDSALSRIESLAAQSSRKETWHKMRGDILLRAERADEARTAYQDAWEALEQLPPKRRKTLSMRRLAEEIQAGLAALNR